MKRRYTELSGYAVYTEICICLVFLSFSAVLWRNYSFLAIGIQPYIVVFTHLLVQSKFYGSLVHALELQHLGNRDFVLFYRCNQSDPTR